MTRQNRFFLKLVLTTAPVFLLVSILFIVAFSRWLYVGNPYGVSLRDALMCLSAGVGVVYVWNSWVER